MAQAGLDVRALGPGQANAWERLCHRCLHPTALGNSKEFVGAILRAALLWPPWDDGPVGRFGWGAFAGEGELVGLIVGRNNHPEAGRRWVDLLLLDPAWRGRGLGGALYRAWERGSVRREVTVVATAVPAGGRVVPPFWRGLGFAAVGGPSALRVEGVEHGCQELRRWPELSRFLDQKGRLMRWPAGRRDQGLARGYLAAEFDEDGRPYTEAQVNEILRQRHSFADWARLRRELCDGGLLAREPDGRCYRRTSGPA